MPVAHSIRSACDTYGIGRSKLCDLLKSGTISARKMGKKTLIDGASLQEWYDGQASFKGGSMPASLARGRTATASTATAVSPTP